MTAASPAEPLLHIESSSDLNPFLLVPHGDVREERADWNGREHYDREKTTTRTSTRSTRVQANAKEAKRNLKSSGNAIKPCHSTHNADIVSTFQSGPSSLHFTTEPCLETFQQTSAEDEDEPSPPPHHHRHATSRPTRSSHPSTSTGSTGRTVSVTRRVFTAVVMTTLRLCVRHGSMALLLFYMYRHFDKSAAVTAAAAASPSSSAYSATHTPRPSSSAAQKWFAISDTAAQERAWRWGFPLRSAALPASTYDPLPSVGAAPAGETSSSTASVWPFAWLSRLVWWSSDSIVSRPSPSWWGCLALSPLLHVNPSHLLGNVVMNWIAELEKVYLVEVPERLRRSGWRRAAVKPSKPPPQPQKTKNEPHDAALSSSRAVLVEEGDERFALPSVRKKEGSSDLHNGSRTSRRKHRQRTRHVSSSRRKLPLPRRASSGSVSWSSLSSSSLSPPQSPMVGTSAGVEAWYRDQRRQPQHWWHHRMKVLWRQMKSSRLMDKVREPILADHHDNAVLAQPHSLPDTCPSGVETPPLRSSHRHRPWHFVPWQSLWWCCGREVLHQVVLFYVGAVLGGIGGEWLWYRGLCGRYWQLLQGTSGVLPSAEEKTRREQSPYHPIRLLASLTHLVFPHVIAPSTWWTTSSVDQSPLVESTMVNAGTSSARPLEFGAASTTSKAREQKTGCATLSLLAATSRAMWMAQAWFEIRVVRSRKACGASAGVACLMGCNVAMWVWRCWWWQRKCQHAFFSVLRQLEETEGEAKAPCSPASANASRPHLSSPQKPMNRKERRRHSRKKDEREMRRRLVGAVKEGGPLLTSSSNGELPALQQSEAFRRSSSIETLHTPHSECVDRLSPFPLCALAASMDPSQGGDSSAPRADLLDNLQRKAQTRCAAWTAITAATTAPSKVSSPIARVVVPLFQRLRLRLPPPPPPVPIASVLHGVGMMAITAAHFLYVYALACTPMDLDVYATMTSVLPKPSLFGSSSAACDGGGMAAGWESLWVSPPTSPSPTAATGGLWCCNPYWIPSLLLAKEAASPPHTTLMEWMSQIRKQVQGWLWRLWLSGWYWMGSQGGHFLLGLPAVPPSASPALITWRGKVMLLLLSTHAGHTGGFFVGLCTGWMQGWWFGEPMEDQQEEVEEDDDAVWSTSSDSEGD